MSPGDSDLSISGPALVPAGLEGAQKLLRDLKPPHKEAARAEISVWDLLSFNKKCTALPLGKNNPRDRYVLGDTHLGRSLAWGSWWTPDCWFMVSVPLLQRR